MELDCGFTKENYWFRYRAAAIIVEDGYVLFAGNENEDYLYSIGGGVHAGETSQEAVEREVYEETGVRYEVDRLAAVHENFFMGHGGEWEGLVCHEVCFYYLMKPRGSRTLDAHGVTHGVREEVHWVPVAQLDEVRAYPTFFAEYLRRKPREIWHIVTDETEGKR